LAANQAEPGLLVFTAGEGHDATRVRHAPHSTSRH
jgi:hypothetical protein